MYAKPGAESFFWLSSCLLDHLESFSETKRVAITLVCQSKVNLMATSQSSISFAFGPKLFPGDKAIFLLIRDTIKNSDFTSNLTQQLRQQLIENIQQHFFFSYSIGLMLLVHRLEFFFRLHTIRNMHILAKYLLMTHNFNCSVLIVAWNFCTSTCNICNFCGCAKNLKQGKENLYKNWDGEKRRIKKNEWKNMLSKTVQYKHPKCFMQFRLMFGQICSNESSYVVVSSCVVLYSTKLNLFLLTEPDDDFQVTSSSAN